MDDDNEIDYDQAEDNEAKQEDMSTTDQTNHGRKHLLILTWLTISLIADQKNSSFSGAHLMTWCADQATF
jgi:hypothetical protein